MLHPLDPVLAADDALLACFRERVVACGLTQTLAREADALLPMPVRQPRFPAMRHALGSRRSDGADLLRLFGYDDALERERARSLFGPELFDGLVRFEILRDERGAVRSTFLLTPTDAGVLVLSDRAWDGADAVMGPATGTSFLAGMIPDRPGAVLDVGCGAGTLALVAAARGATRAVGVDVNARASAMSGLNARLNGLTAEFACGDLCEPVRGARFDRLVAHPPFVPSPPGVDTQVFMHGGAMGDELALRLLAEAPGVLAPAGLAFISFLSPRREAPLTERLNEVVGAARCDVVALRLPSPSPLLTAVAFASYGAADLGPDFAALVARYLDHLHAIGVRETEGLLVCLAGYDDDRERCAVALPCDDAAIDATELDALVRRVRALHAPDAALARQRLAVDPRLRLTTRKSIDSSAPATMRLEFGPGSSGVPSEIDPDELGLLRQLAAAPSVEHACVALARSRRVAIGAIRADVLAFVRRALLRGHLVPA